MIELTIESFSGTQALENAIHLDEFGGQIEIESTDFSLIGESATLSIGVVQSSKEQPIKTLPLTVELQVLGTKPEFDMSNVSVSALTCSIDDAGWSFKLPPVKQADQ